MYTIGQTEFLVCMLNVSLAKIPTRVFRDFKPIYTIRISRYRAGGDFVAALAVLIPAVDRNVGPFDGIA